MNLRKLGLILSVLALLTVLVSPVTADDNNSITVSLVATRADDVNSIRGTVELTQTEKGTVIEVRALGIVPGIEYLVSYHNQANCAPGFSSKNQVIGRLYTENHNDEIVVAVGVANTELQNIGAVMVTQSGSVVACAVVHRFDTRG